MTVCPIAPRWLSLCCRGEGSDELRRSHPRALASQSLSLTFAYDAPAVVFLPMSEAARKAFACPPVSGVLDDIDLALVDRDDEEERRILIEAEHPELKKALDEGRDEVHQGREVMSPALHIAMHEIVTNQLWADDPPEMWQAAQRLTSAGYDRHEVLHMLSSVVSGQVWEAMANKASYDIERVRLELAALPEGWEARRDEWRLELSRDRAERRAKERRRRPAR